MTIPALGNLSTPSGGDAVQTNRGVQHSLLPLDQGKHLAAQRKSSIVGVPFHYGERQDVSDRKSRNSARGPFEATPVRYSKSLYRRKDLLGTVYECVAKYGIDGLGMRQLAEAAGISTGTINYHFGNKHNLLMAALEAAYELPEDWEDYKGSPFAQLRRLVTGYAFKSTRERFWYFWINYTAQGTRDENMRLRQEKRFDRQRKFWAALIRDAIEQGEIEDDVDADKVADRLLIFAQGVVIHQIQSPSVEVREGSLQLLEELVVELLPKKKTLGRQVARAKAR